RATRMLGSEPVEEHAIGDLPGQAAHLGTESRHHEARRKLGPERGDSVAHASESARVRASDAEEETTEGQRVGSHALDDALRSARVEGDHADPELDAPCLLRSQYERHESVVLALMDLSEVAVPERFRLL